jgi:short subunit fatty acids transporter
MSDPIHDDGNGPLALAAGLTAALIGGAVWAGLVIVTNMEIGFVAWGLGLLVGFAMAKATSSRTLQLARAAAAFAVLGLLVGKVFIFVGGSYTLASRIAENDDALAGVVAWQMYEDRELDDVTLADIDAVEAAGDTLSDALWLSMTAQAATRVQSLSNAERKEVAARVASNYFGNASVVDGVVGQLSLFDVLWLILAVGTAYRMLAPPKYEMVDDAEDPEQAPSYSGGA